MAELKQALVPDIGDYHDVPVIEVLVAVGDHVQKDQGLVTLESDKATLEVPSSVAGVVKELKVRIGDTLSQGGLVALIEADDDVATPPAAPAPARPRPLSQRHRQRRRPRPAVWSRRVPDIGDYHDVPVIELLVSVGDTVKKDQGLVTLESDKATMEVPSSVAGVVKEIKVKVGDTLSQGAWWRWSNRRSFRADGNPGQRNRRAGAAHGRSGRSARPPGRPRDRAGRSQTRALGRCAEHAAGELRRRQRAAGQGALRQPDGARVRARAGRGPAQVKGSEKAGRITKEDVQRFVKAALSGGAPVPPVPAPAGGGLNLLPWPKVDFAKFGDVEVQPLSRIKKISGANLARNWAMIPHVTQFDRPTSPSWKPARAAQQGENEKAASS
jgi:pyruvate dehydrogenase E2 component (dihydrolipoamide acetyltransferase)